MDRPGTKGFSNCQQATRAVGGKPGFTTQLLPALKPRFNHYALYLLLGDRAPQDLSKGKRLDPNMQQACTTQSGWGNQPNIPAGTPLCGVPGTDFSILKSGGTGHSNSRTSSISPRARMKLECTSFFHAFKPKERLSNGGNATATVRPLRPFHPAPEPELQPPRPDLRATCPLTSQPAPANGFNPPGEEHVESRSPRKA